MINRPVALQSVHLKTHPRDTLYCQLHSRVSWYNIFALPSAGSFCEMFHTLFAYRTPSSVTRGFLSFFLSLSFLLCIYIFLSFSFLLAFILVNSDREMIEISTLFHPTNVSRTKVRV